MKLLLFFFLSFWPRESVAPVHVSGTIADAESWTPIGGAEVSYNRTTVRSDDRGRYRIDLPPGVRELRIAAPGRAAVTKFVIADDAGASIRLDALIPAHAVPGKHLVLDRRSNVSLTDQFGNSDELLPLAVGRGRAWSPIWLDAGAIAYGLDRTIHRPENAKLLGVYRYRIAERSTEQLVAGIPTSFLTTSPRTGALAIANQKALYVGDRRIFDLPANGGHLLSIAWAADNRIYFTVEDRIPLDDRHSIGRSRIASMAPDGSGLRDWASGERLSYRYPLGEGADLLFGRFDLDGANQTVRLRGPNQPERQLATSALRPVHLDPAAQRLYFIDRAGLHLRDLRAGADFVIVSSVESADYRRD